MSDRLPSGMLVAALLRRVNDAGGMGMMLARGEATGGSILVIALAKGRDPKVFERGIGPDGTPGLIAWTPRDSDDASETTYYWQRRRGNDPDLWVIELDTPFAERFAAEVLLDD